MKRSEFLKTLGMGVAAVAVAPVIIDEIVSNTKFIAGIDPINVILTKYPKYQDIIVFEMYGKEYWLNIEQYKAQKAFYEEKEKELFNTHFYINQEHHEIK